MPLPVILFSAIPTWQQITTLPNTNTDTHKKLIYGKIICCMDTFLVQSNLAPISTPLLELGLVLLLSFGQNTRSDMHNFGMRMVLELHGARAAK